ncbi:MAG: ABC transporter permease [Spirochaetales bacterium]
MSRRWIFFVAARHFRTKRKQKGHTAGILSILGIAVGVMTLNGVLAVMNGFQLGTIQDILEVGSYHLQVEGFPEERDAATAADELSQEPWVTSAVTYSDLFGLASGYFQNPTAIVVRSVPPDIRAKDTGLASSLEIISGSFALNRPDAIVLGDELARRLGIRVGDQIQVVGFDGRSGGALGSASASLDVVGLFKSGFLEYDAGWGYVSPATARTALGMSPGQTLGIKLADRFSDRQAAERVRARYPGVEVVSWREYNRSIFGALRLEKTMMMMLVGLIFVVVAVNIYQSLRRSVVERTEEIGVLKAIGARPGPLQLVFVFEGALIGLAGAAIGTTLGLLISSNINELFAAAEFLVNAITVAGDWIVAVLRGESASTAAGGFSLFSPSYFYLDRVPAVVVTGELVGIFLFAFFSATIAAYAASRRVSRITPAEVLRYE